MPSARKRAAQQQKAAQNIGTGSPSRGPRKDRQSPAKAAQNIGTGSPSRGPPKDRQSPATEETLCPSKKKKKTTKPLPADFATVTPIAGVMKSAAENSDVLSQSSSVATLAKAGKDDAGNEESAANKSTAGQDVAGNEDGTSEDDSIDDDKPNLAKGKRRLPTSGDFYHFIIII